MKSNSASLLLFILTFQSPQRSLSKSVRTAPIDDPACSPSVQQVSFHHEWDLSGDFQTFCSNRPDIQSTPGHARTAKYLCAERGVWIIGTSFNGVPSPEGVLINANIGWICVGFPEQFEIKYLSARHLSSANINSSVLSLYDLRYRGVEFRLDGRDVRLPAPIPISTYALTGLEPFTIFKGTDFNGESQCIVPGANNPFPPGVSFLDQTTIETVGSVRRGCSQGMAELSSKLAEIDATTVRVQAAPEVLAQMKIIQAGGLAKLESM